MNPDAFPPASTRPPAPGRSFADLGVWISAGGLALWIGSGSIFWLPVSAAGLVWSLRDHARTRGFRDGIGRVVLLAALLSAFVAESRALEVTTNWDAVREARESRLGDRLARELDALLRDGERVADRAATLLAGSLDEWPRELARARRGSGVDALAVYGADGSLLAWDGIHQGALPPEVVTGESTYLYRERPLFGYLYTTVPLESGGGTAVSAILLQTDLPPGMDGGGEGFADVFEREWGVDVQISHAHRARGEGIWDLRWEGETLLSVAMAPPGQGESITRIRLRWAGWVLGLVLLAWLVLLHGAGERLTHRWGAAVTLLLLASAIPSGVIPGPVTLFSPEGFLLPGPGEVTLGRALLVAAAGVVGLALIPSDPGVIPTRLAIGLVPVLLLGGAAWIGGASGPHFLAMGEGEWVAYYLLLAMVTTLLVWALVRIAVVQAAGPRPAALLGASLLASVLLAAGAAASIRIQPVFPVWVAVLWTLPVAPLLFMPTDGKMLLRGGRWFALMVIGGSLALPLAWSDRIEARMAIAAEQVDRLGTRVDPYLEFLLLRLGEGLESARAQEGTPVETLYRGWVESGMVWEGVPVWLTYWSPGGLPQEELRIGVPDSRPAFPVELPVHNGSEQAQVHRFELADLHYLAVLPLSDGSIVTAAVPPRRALTRSPFRSGLPAGIAQGLRDPLTLVPLHPGDVPPATGELEWVRSPQGWHGETVLAYPDQIYQGHFDLTVAPPLVRVARATLLVLLHLGVGAILWATAVFLPTGLPVVGDRWWAGLLMSFRSRVTVALLAFFLVPTIVWGTLARGALSAAATRTAQTLAERAVDEAAFRFEDFQGSIELLAGRVGGELLLYQDGGLVGGHPRELVELGLYPGWLPSDVHSQLASGEQQLASRIVPLGGWDHAVAFRRLPQGRVLATTAPVQIGATAVRQRDLMDLLGLAIVVGALLSLALAVLVGRALARPIQTLRVASERVGAGNLGVRIPPKRSDEFAPVFEAFGHMVLRLRQARRALVRSSRRTRAIVEEAATGVVALDPSGRVTLSNPRAAGFLGTELSRGEPLPEVEGPAGDLARWVARYFADGLQEGGMELIAGERRIRVRARRISREGTSGGAVLSLEDVTDELRSERILAWGEMARQVAHEVKNPLTPVKLGIQHIRRAWHDDRDDFGEILDRNATAILGEIDRLAAIASSFSRFGAPGMVGAGPLEPVTVEEVVEEVTTLYNAGEDGVRVLMQSTPGLPPARARVSELKEVLVNLLENARQALPGGGVVRIHISPREGGLVMDVMDEGIGIEPELLPRVFEPHFSTRTGGSGLGLAIVQRLVESWGGTVAADSRPGRGTTVRVRLPAWREGESARGDGESDPG